MEEEAPTVTLENPEEIFNKHSNNWYEVSTNYWEKQERNDNGMLGGFPEVSGMDVLSSRDLIEKYQKKGKLGNSKAADCGAGIGRVAYLCLSDFFKHIDLIDPVADFLAEAEKKLKDTVTYKSFVMGIQDWVPEDYYDCIWAQWSIMYLTDSDAISFLKRCRDHLSPKGMIFIKDNISSKDLTTKKELAQYFHEDNGICRTYIHYIELFAKSGLKVIETEKQSHYPPNLLPLYTFILSK